MELVRDEIDLARYRPDVVRAQQGMNMGTIEGRVTDAATGQPIANVGVRADYSETWNSSAQARTDVNGFYSMTILSTAPYSFRTFNTGQYVNERYDDVACPPCRFASGKLVQPIEGKTISGVDFALVRGAVVKGVIRSAEDGRAIPEVDVDLYDLDGRAAAFAITDLSGRYSTRPGLPTGSYEMYATDWRFDFVRQLYNGIDCTLGQWSCADYDRRTPVQLTTGVDWIYDFSMTPYPAISGRVTAAKTGLPVRQMSGVAGGQSFTTDDDGRYRVLVQPGTRYAHVLGSNLFEAQIYKNIPCTPSCDPTKGTPIEIVHGRTVQGIDFALTTVEGSIQGKVFDAKTLAPLQAKVVLRGLNSPDLIVTPNLDGRFVQTVMPGYYRAYVTDPAYVDQIHRGRWCEPCDTAYGDSILVDRGQNVSDINFAILTVVVTAVKPDRGSVTGGDQLTLEGFGFQPGATVSVGGTPAEVLSVQPQVMRVRTPAGKTPGTAEIVVTNPNLHTATTGSMFWYVDTSLIELSSSPLQMGRVGVLTLRISPDRQEPTVVTLTSSAPHVVSVPASITIAPGIPNHQLTITATQPGQTVITATLPPSLGSRSASAVVQVVGSRSRGVRR